MENDFPQGIRVFKKHEKAPDFIIADITISDIQAFSQDALKNEKGGETRLQIKEGKSGNYYLAWNDYRPNNNSDFPN